MRLPIWLAHNDLSKRLRFRIEVQSMRGSARGRVMHGAISDIGQHQAAFTHGLDHDAKQYGSPNNNRPQQKPAASLAHHNETEHGHQDGSEIADDSEKRNESTKGWITTFSPQAL